MQAADPNLCPQVVKERQRKIRHMLLVNGTSGLMYWLSLLVRDLAVLAVPVGLLLILLPSVRVRHLSGLAMLPIALVLLLYMPMIVLLAHVLSFAFKSWEMAQQVLGAGS